MSTQNDGMDVAEVHQHPMDAEPSPTLVAWDWRAELKRQERSYSGLARRTARSESAVNKYANGRLVPPVAWLESARIVLGVTPIMTESELRLMDGNR